MKHLSLATRYRPQRFSEVAGQDLIKAVLSRASAEDRVASGYLLSGTRGVGKTTIARIFAKALNCEHAPCAEPCNTCEQCRRITQGNHPDVIELDGASNNTVDDARALRETVGFAPMEGRYKIFIIDEAHMLTRNAFNALLKTLEEPPQHVVFIFATTELFRFPATILSRCQVFSFRHLSEDTIAAHLSRILQQENVPCEEDALRLIARRAAGSARDSMSLLDQILAYGSEKLTAETVRMVLGLAGMDALASLFDALARADCAGTALFTRELVSKEVDIGFFLRELTDYFRSLFLLRQCDRDAVARLGVPAGELDFLETIAPRFTPSYLHAAWQMILSAQRSVTVSQEPASALELLLVNLALLPHLLPSSLVFDQGSAEERAAPRPRNAGVTTPADSTRPAQQPQGSVLTAAPRPSPAGSTAAPGAPAAPSQASVSSASGPDRSSWQKQRNPASSVGSTLPQGRSAQSIQATQPAQHPHVQAESSAQSRDNAPTGAKRPVQPEGPVQAQVTGQTAPPQTAAASAAPAATPKADSETPGATRSVYTYTPPVRQPAWSDSNTDSDEGQEEDDFEEVMGDAPMGQIRMASALPDWAAYRAFAQQTPGSPAPYLLNGVRCTARRANTLVLEADNASQLASLRRALPTLESSLSQFLKTAIQVELSLSERGRTHAQAQSTPVVLDRPELKYCFELLKAHVDHVQRR